MAIQERVRKTIFQLHRFYLDEGLVIISRGKNCKAISVFRDGKIRRGIIRKQGG